MKKNKKLQNFLKYIYVPIIMAIIGFTIIYITAKPLINMAYSVGGMILSDNSPEFTIEVSSIYDEAANRLTSGTIKLSDIQIPKYEQQYAEISCKRLNMQVPLYWGDSDRVFKYGAGQYIGSSIPGRGKLIVAGAHDSMYFEPLKDVRIGDVFTINTNYGTYTYKVLRTLISTANDEDACVSTTGNEQLIMYTCYPFGALIGSKNKRFYVYCEYMTGPLVQE